MTNQKINNLIPPGALTKLTRLVLASAIYFKGDWKTKFDSEATRPWPFYIGPTNTVQVDMMNMENKGRPPSGIEFRYNENDQFQVLGLPYKGDELFMFVFLPRQRHGLAELEKSLGGKDFLEEILDSYQERLEKVTIPKFKESIGLVKIFSALGVTDMFDNQRADFSGINGRRDLVVSDAVHTAIVEVNEEGTVAAALFGPLIGYGLKPIIKPSFVADHPFLFAVVDTRSTSILFVGRYSGK